jgi:DNA-binding response OmpR family regulator
MANERLFILEDDSMVSGMMKIMLERSGFACDVASDEDQAVELFNSAQGNGQVYAAVIFDLVLAEDSLGGLRTLKRIKEADPNVKTILCSGFCSSPVVKNFRNYGFDSCLSKPFTGSSLKSTLLDLTGP